MHVEIDSIHCCGCTACSSVCPVKAIQMKEDAEGFLIPVVDETRCIECRQCVNVCPAKKDANTVDKTKQTIIAYAAKYEDEIRYNSASGGFFPALAKYVIEKENGWVCGCVLNRETLMPEHIVSNQWADVQRMQDSKYVQSNMRDCYCEIGNRLKENQFVLFTGTSCQVAGLYAYLDLKRIQREKLLTVDFFCHGVPSPKIWKEYLLFYQKTKKKKPVGYRFRCKKYGWGNSNRCSSHLNSITYSNTIKVTRLDNVSWASRMWRSVFFSNLCIRQYCHSCPYACAEKPADITMGDFWGIENCYPDFDDGKGSSIVLSRTEKANEILKAVEWLTLRSVKIEDALHKQANAFKPSPPNPLRDEFWKDYKNEGFGFCARKYFGYTTKNRVRQFVKRVLFELKLHNLY